MEQGAHAAEQGNLFKERMNIHLRCSLPHGVKAAMLHPLTDPLGRPDRLATALLLELRSRR